MLKDNARPTVGYKNESIYGSKRTWFEDTLYFESDEGNINGTGWISNYTYADTIRINIINITDFTTIGAFRFSAERSGP